MNTSSDNKIKKPEIIKSLLSGFDTIANKPILMLIPIILDLFLWFGPAWRVDDFIMPIILRFSNIPGIETAEIAEMMTTFQSIWQDILSNFNLAASLRTIPFGVPSLMVSRYPFLNPLGSPMVFNLVAYHQIILLWLVFLLVGLILGFIYYRNISNQIITLTDEHTLKAIFVSFFQIILIPILLILFLMILSIPVLFLITLITLISPAISQFFAIIFGVVLIWILMPLIFTPHGIFLYKQNLIAAMMTSVSVVRFSMAKTAWFLLASYVLIEGLDYLWQSPTVDNWFLLIGILGRAFVVTAVVAASFHYFIDATEFSQAILMQKTRSAKS